MLKCPQHNTSLYYVKYETQEDAEVQITQQLHVDDRPVFYCLKMHFFSYYWEDERFVELGYKKDIFNETD